MKEWPALYTAPMIRAQLAGAKTQTRRPLYVLTKRGSSACFDRRYEPPAMAPFGYFWTLSRWHRAKPGDIIWARENCWQRPERTPKMMREGADTWAPFYYDADGLSEQDVADFKAWGFKRRPSIHMPRAACRITREITENRVERLQNISLEDAIAEGMRQTIGLVGDDDLAVMNAIRRAGWSRGTFLGMPAPVARYVVLWETINGPGSWEVNPWVCVISFEPVSQPTRRPL
jgi:hypothetical protein